VRGEGEMMEMSGRSGGKGWYDGDELEVRRRRVGCWR
jgi:hypothetical protein